MYAIVKIGSSQFKVQEGDFLTSNRLESEIGKDITLENILMIGDEKDVKIGTPYLKDAKVTAKVIEHNRGRKLTSFKYRKRKDSSTKVGHRQAQTVLNITKISA